MVASPAHGSGWLARLGSGITWAVFVVAVAIGGSGLTLALDHPQTDSGRPELTQKGDSLVTPRLEAMAPALAQMAAAADALSTQARVAYGHVHTRDTASARADLPLGDAAAAAVTSAAAGVQAARATLLDGTSLAGVSDSNRQWIAAIDAALASAAKEPDLWALIANAAVLPISVAETLADHDAIVLAATQLARISDYAGAAAKLTDTRADIARAKALATQAEGKGLDASTLSGLVSRSSAYDEALIGLYAILTQTGGVMTDQAQAALDLVNRAEQALPTDASVMTVIMSDLGGQTMTEGLIDLEQLRGDILLAVNRPGSAPAPEPSATP